jgi:hypothetical protein
LLDNLNAQFHNQILVKFKKFRDLRLAGVMGNDELALATTDCAAALFHFREHIPAPHSMSRKDVSSQCPDYKLIADVTNAVKHGVISREPVDGPALLNSAADIFELGIIINFEGRGETYSHSEPVVCIDCTDGTRRCLDDAVANVVNYWGSELKRLGVRDFQPFDQLPFPGTALITPEEAHSIHLGAVRGLKFATKWQLMKFDYDEGFARPTDLTGADVKFRMYRPKHTLDITLNIPSSDEDYVHKIELSDEQSQEYLKLSTKAEKQTFQNHIATENKEEIEAGLIAFIELHSRDAAN